ncbi:MAG: 4Fe-4S binding protein [Candidatus Bathyarchaeota archaeon]|nr:4Fe-4S binding protein [Candidatus Bathyarchaeota archaeon]
MDWQLIGDILRLTVLAGLGIAGILAVLIWKKNLATKVTFLRLVIQAVAFAALFYFFTFSIPLLYVLIGLFVVTLFLGRFYCGWVCPFGLIMDLESMLRKALKKRYRIIPDRLNRALHKSRYAIFLFFMLTPIALWLLDPPQNFDFAVMMARLLAGPFRPYSVLIDPMIPNVVPWTGQLIINDINFSYAYAQDIIAFMGENIGQIFLLAFVTVTLIGGFFIRRVWCRFCPTGASLGVINRFKAFKWAPLLHIYKDEEKCTKCGVCKRVCPLQVNEVYDQKGGKIETSQCMVCARCVEMCPYEGTLQLKLGNKSTFTSRNWLEPSKSE